MALLGNVSGAQVSLLLFDVQVIHLTTLWLLDLISHVEVIGACLLCRNNFGAVHVDLIDSVIEFVSI